MRIGMILSTSFPPDIRVEKELTSLLKEHEVFLLCPKRGKNPGKEVWKGMTIFRVFSNIERGLSNFKLMAICYSKSWEREIDRYIKDNNLEVLHVHDLPLLGTALEVSHKYGIPVVADLHENYPAMLAECKKTPIYNCVSWGSLFSKFTVSIARWAAYEKSVVPQADAVITVIEEARDRLILAGVPSSKLYVVANYNAKPEAYDDYDDKMLTLNKPDKVRVVYAGGFDGTRDIHTVIDAVALLKKTDVTGLEVVLVGGVGRALTDLKRYAARKGVTDRVSIHAWIPQAEAEKMLDNAQVGLVPHVKSAHTDATIPHKLFQYMSRRMPVIVSDCTPLERIVVSSNCGFVYRSGDDQSLADCLKKIYQRPTEIKRMGEAGQVAVQEKYNWGQSESVLLEVYRMLSQKKHNF